MITRKVLGETYIINGKPADVADFIPDMSLDIYYEVIRLMDHKILFFGDHLERLQHSLMDSGLNYPGSDFIRENLQLLVQHNNFTAGNIRICLQPNSGNNPTLLCYFIPYIYPEECMYKSGVQLVTYPHMRPNPGIKKWDDAFRISVSEYIRDYGVYEVILLNDLLQVTEGSRSNIFFVDHLNHLITAPEKDVLPGITRKYVLKICAEEGIEIFERPINLNELEELSVCFITGTSPKILPVWQLNAYEFKADHPVLKLLMERYESLIKENLTSLV